jgi:Na+/H+-dicarboxylate symporter
MVNHLSLEQQTRYCTGAIVSADELQEIDTHLSSCVSCRDALYHALRENTGTLRRSLLPARDETHCLDDQTMTAYVREQLDATDREVVEAHIALCPRCAEDVASLQSFHEQMLRFDWTTLPSETLRERLRRWFHFHEFGRLPTFGQVHTWWEHYTLTARILTALVIGLLLGLVLGGKATVLEPVSTIVLRLLGALATPLIFVAIIHAFLKANVNAATARKLVVLLLTNTLFAIVVGLVVVNVFKPGQHVTTAGANQIADVASLHSLAHRMPPSILSAMAENNIVYVILAAIGIGIALRSVRTEQRRDGRNGYKAVEDLAEVTLLTLTKMIRWVIALVPFAVCAIIANLVGRKDFETVRSLGGFVGAVLFALAIQAVYYLIRLRLGSWVTPANFLRSGRSAFLTAFWTASSAATMPVTYRCMRERVGLRDESTSLGILVGGSLNRDGTALYQTMASIFVAQLTGVPIALPRQLTVILTSVMASIGAPGIPEAGMVTMLMIFRSLGLREEYIGLLLAVDWFLDRCRTMINVMGHTSVTCILDGKVQHPEAALHPAVELP